MSLIEYTMLGKIDKVKQSIERLRAFEPEDGYSLAFSGGKDSVCIKALADMAGVKYDAHYSITSVDPPELVQFIKTFPDVIRESAHYKPGRGPVSAAYPNGGGPVTMWNLIPLKRMPPTRVQRYCCEFLKESNGAGRIVVTGVRWDESSNRKANRNLVDIGGKGGALVYNDDNDEARRTVEQCYRTKKTLVNPIIDWTTEDVWEFIRAERIPYCGLYDDGFNRLGCIGCPMNTRRADRDFKKWPKYYDSYLRAFDRMLRARAAAGLVTRAGETAQGIMDWWLDERRSDDRAVPGQMLFTDIMGEMDE